MKVEEAWTLDGAGPVSVSFDDIRLTGEDPGVGQAPAQRIFTLVGEPDEWWALQLQKSDPFQADSYVSAVAPFVTTDVDAAATFTFTRVVPRGVAAQPARRRAVATLPGDTPQTLRGFLTQIGAPLGSPWTVTALLPALVGRAATATLTEQITLAAIKHVLGWHAKLDESQVTWVEDGHGPLVRGAHLALELGTPQTITIDDQAEAIASGEAILTFAGNGPLTFEVAILTASGIRLADDASVAAPTRSRPLDQYLHDLGADPAKWAQITLGTLLSAMVGAQPIAERLLLRAPSFIAAAGIAQWRLDHELSEVAVDVNLAGDSEVARARIVATTPAGIERTIEGVHIGIAQVAITIRDARLPAMEVVLEATATIGTVQLSARSVLSDEGGTLELALPDGATLADLGALLPGSPQLGALSVPVAARALSELAFSDPSIVIRQPATGAGAYELAEVRGTVTFTGWAKLLPTGWPAPAATSLTVRVLRPLDAAHRQVALDAVFAFQIGSKSFEAELSATPLPESQPVWSYALRLRGDPTTQPATVAEILGAVGLSGPLATLGSTLPAIGGAASKIAVASLVLGLSVPPTGPTTWDELDLELVLADGWPLIAGVIDLSAAAIRLRYDGEWSGDVRAAALLGGQHEVTASAQLPTATAPGALSVQSTAGLTLLIAAQIAGLGDLSTLPVAGTLLAVEIASAELSLDYEQGHTVPSIAAATIELHAGDRVLGALSMSALAVEVTRVLHGEGAPATRLSIEAEWEHAIASLIYDSTTGELAADLRMVGEATIASMLSALLGTTVPNALLPFVGSFKVRDGSLRLDGADLSLLGFDIRLDPSASLHVGPAAVSDLSIRYVAAAGATQASYVVRGTTSGPGTSAVFELACQPSQQGTIAVSIVSAPGTSGLTASGLLALMGLTKPPVLAPDGAPAFFDVTLAQASATLTLAGELTLATLSATVVTTASLQLLASPSIVLQGLALHIDYAATATPTTSGYVVGHLTLGAATIEVRYVERAGQREFSAALRPASAPDFRALIASGALHPGYALPTDMGLPSTVPLTELRVVAQPGRFVDVSGYADATLWNLQVDALALRVTALGGHVRVQAPAQQGGATQWDVELVGKLSYRGFVSTTVTFEWGPQQASILTATATAASAPAIELPAIAGSLQSATPWTDVAPSGTAAIAFGDAAYLYLDLTAGVVALYGTLASLGTAALLSITRNGVRSWMFVIGLSEGFEFASLWNALAVVDSHLRVTRANAALMAYGGTAAQLQTDLASVAAYAHRQGVAFAVPFADLPAPTGSDALAPIPKGCSFFAELDLTGGTVGPVIAALAAGAPTVLVSARIDHGTPANTAYSLALKAIVLLGGKITLDAVGTYRPSQPDTLTAAGTLTVRLTDGGPAYAFHGSLTIGAAATTFVLSGDQQPAAIAQPFAGMVGIATLTAPTLAAEFHHAQGAPTTSTITITGSVALTIANATQTIDTSVRFVDGTPRVVDLSIAGGLPVLDLFANLISPGGGAGWPTGFQPFTLENARIAYADLASGQAPIVIAGRTYRPGYHATAAVTFLGTAFEVDLAIAPGRAGIVVSGTHVGSIGLGVVELTGYVDGATQTTTQGPTVEIDTTTPGATTYAIAGGVSLFKTSLLQTRLSYRPQSAKWAATATYPGVLLGVTNPSIDLTYSDAEGLRIVKWPLLSALGDALEHATMLADATQGGTCGQLLGLDFTEKAITTSFDFTLSQRGAITGNSLPLALNGTYSVSVVGVHDPLFTLPLPQIEGSIAAPHSFELSALPGWIEDVIQANAACIAKSLLKDTVGGQKALKILIAEFAISYAGPVLLTRLLCEGADSENVTAQAAKTVNTEFGSLEGAGGPVAAVTGPAASAAGAGGLGAAAGFFAEATAALPALAAAVATLGALITAAWAWLTQDQRDHKAAAEGKLTAAQAALADARAKIEKRLAMTGAPAIAFTAKTSLTVTWAAANRPAQQGYDYGGYAGFSYRADVATDPAFAHLVSSQTTAGWSVTVTSDVLARQSTVYARVAAVYTAGANAFAGTPIVGSAVHPVALPAPASVAEALVNDAIAVTVASVANATSYTVTLSDTAHGGAHVATKTVAAAAAVQCSFAAADLPTSIAAGAVLLASAVATGEPATTEPSPSASAPPASAVHTAGPPVGLTATVTPGAVAASWSAVAGAASYEVRAVDVHGAPLSPAPAIAITATTCAISGGALKDGLVIVLKVRAVTPHAMGLWASTQVDVKVLPAPVIAEARFYAPENEIRISWSAVAGASGYHVAVAGTDEHPLTPAPTITIHQTSATVSGAAIAAGAQFKLRARAAAPGAIARWSAWRSVNATTVVAPAALTFAYANADAVLHATWGPVAAHDGFLATLLLDDTVIARSEPTSSPVSFGSPPTVTLVPGKTYRLDLRTRVADSIGPAATRTAGVPTLLEIARSDVHTRTAAQAGADLVALVPTVGPAHMFYALRGGGYTPNDARAATRDTLTHVTADQLDAIVGAVLHLGDMINQLLGEHVDGPTTVALVRAILSPSPLELVVGLKSRRVGSAGLAKALGPAYGMTAAAATALVEVLWEKSWLLGGVLHADGVSPRDGANAMYATYRQLLPVQGTASFKHGGYDLQAPAVCNALQTRYATTSQQWTVIHHAVLDDSTGSALARQLHDGGVPRATAAAYVAACWGELSAAQVQTAVTRWYGPT